MDRHRHCRFYGRLIQEALIKYGFKPQGKTNFPVPLVRSAGIALVACTADRQLNEDARAWISSHCFPEMKFLIPQPAIKPPSE